MCNLHLPATYYRGIRYPEYLQLPHWYKLSEKLIYDNPKAACWVCGRGVFVSTKQGKKTSNLLLHHVRYENLFHEKLYRDVYVVCYSCHKRIHFSLLTGKQTPLEYSTLVKRMWFLKVTYPIRSFRLGALVNDIFHYLYDTYVDLG